MIQINDFCIIAVLNDSCAGFNLFSDLLNKISGKLSPFQIREIVAHLNYINLNLKDRPIYKSMITESGQYKITAEIPENLSLIDKKERISSPGDFLEYYVREMIGDIADKEMVLEQIKKGKRNYLIDEDGNFINHN